MLKMSRADKNRTQKPEGLLSSKFGAWIIMGGLPLASRDLRGIAGQASLIEEHYVLLIMALLFVLTMGLIWWNRALQSSVQSQTDAVKASEQRLADIINFLPDAALAIDMEGRAIIWNRAIEAMTGIPAAEMLGKGDFEYALPFYGERRPILIDLIFSNHQEIEEKYSFINRIGDVLFTETTVPKVKGVPRVLAGKASPLYDLHGNIMGAIETIRDVTENHEAQNLLKESQRRMADIIDFLPDATLAIDREGRLIIWNRAVEAMTGIPGASMLGKGDYEYAIPFYGERRPILLDLLFVNRADIEAQYSFIHRIGDTLFTETSVPKVKGIPRVLSAKASPLYDLAGNIVGAIESIRDVTERHEADAALKESVQRMEELITIITNSPAIAVLWNLAPGWPVAYVSDNISILGYSAEEFLSGQKVFADIVHPDDLERIEREVEQYMAASKEEFKQEYRLIDSQGNIVWMDDRTWARRDPSGQLTYFQGILLDITARKEAEQGMEIVNRQLQDIIAFLPDATLVLDRDSRIIAWNQAMERLSGAPREQMLGQTSAAASRLFYDDVRPLMVDMAMQGEEAIADYYTEYELIDKTIIAEHFVPGVYGGQGAYVQGIAAPLFDAGGHLNGAIECLRDISRQKEADDIRRQDEMRMGTMLDLYVMARSGSEQVLDFALEAGITITSSAIGYIAFYKEAEEEFEIVSWSHQAMEECQASSPPEGYRLESIGLWGEPIRQRRAVVTNDYANADPAIKKGVPEGHIPIIRHLSIPVWEGDRIVALAGVGNKDSDYNESDVNQLTLLMNGLWGILQRKQAEEQRERLQDMLRDIFDYMPSMLCSIDHELNITQWNRQAEIEIGISRQQALGQNLQQVMERRPRTLNLVATTMKEGRVCQEDISYKTEQGVQRTLNVTVYPLELEAGRGAVIRSDDISDKRRMQEIMIQTEKILSVGGMAAGMAHEINNPLGGILQGIQNIYRRMDPTLPQNQQIASECEIDLEKVQQYIEKRQIGEFMEGIRESGTRAARIVGNMLQFSRQAENRMSCVHLGHILDNALELASGDYDLRKRYDFKHFEIVKKYDLQQEEVLGIETELEQVALNILKNAAQAYSEAERRERRPRIVLRTYDEGAMAVFEIEDNGPGMPEEIRRHVFDPFYTTKPPGEGTGLGLSVSYYIIANNHRGQMYVESAPGQGSRFIIKIPRTPLDE